MSIDTTISIGDIVGSVGVIVAIIVGTYSSLLARKANRVAANGVLVSREALEFARLTTERERIEWTPAASAEISGDGANRAVTITNIHRAAFTICGIIFNMDKESVACRGGEIRSGDCKYLPQLLPSGASVTFRIPEFALKQIPVDVTPGVILELPARQTLVCNVC